MEFGYIWNSIFGRKHSLINAELNYRIALGFLTSHFSDVTRALTHWGRVTHICASKLTIIGSDNGLSPGRHQAISWTNVGILLIRTLGTNFSEIIGEIHSFSFSKMHLKMSSAKWRLFGLGLSELSRRNLILFLTACVARVRGDPPLLQSAMDILWRLRFSRLRQAPSRKAWYSRGPVKSKIIASYVHENFYLWYFILPQIMVFPCSINITARLACTNNHTCSTDSLARLIIGFKSTK